MLDADMRSANHSPEQVPAGVNMPRVTKSYITSTLAMPYMYCLRQQEACCVVFALQAKIQEALEAERVVVADVYGDGRHVNIDVVSAAFEGKSSVARQRMVYKVGPLVQPAAGGICCCQDISVMLQCLLARSSRHVYCLGFKMRIYCRWCKPSCRSI
jgi:acid stress-induced BolA-like protein IbaG/YrbA